MKTLVNEGNIGLLKAVHKYDETRGFKFISYAVWWISQQICNAIHRTGRVIRLPSHVAESMGKLYKQSIELEQQYEREPTTEELAEITDTTIKGVEDLTHFFRRYRGSKVRNLAPYFNYLFKIIGSAFSGWNQATFSPR